MITVEKTMRKAEVSSVISNTKKKPIPKWFWGLVIVGVLYAAYSHYKKDKSGEVSNTSEA